MKLLLKQVKIISPSSPFHGKVTDILVENGIIVKIIPGISIADAELVEHPNLHVSIGWMDIFANFADPGYEHRENLIFGAAAAAAGGFTDVMVIPNTSPVVSSKTQVEYILQKAIALPVRIYPIATITKNAEGKELAEMYDMSQSGAVAFSDGINSIQSPGILLKALQYILSMETSVIQVPNDRSIGAQGLMNEGVSSTRLGLPGIPAIAEELMIARDIELLRYTNSRLHLTGVSTKKGLDLVQAAREEGLQISASVTPYHGWFCDEDLSGYDTNLKTDPPLRSSADKLAVRDAIKNGTVDCYASHHFPQHPDDKECEFEYAKKGMIGLETMFGAINSFEPVLEDLITKLTLVPRRLFQIELPQIAEGEVACLTLFDPDARFTFTEQMICSKSRNSAFIGKELRGKVIGIISKNNLVLNTNT
jgi:dihydroorotase